MNKFYIQINENEKGLYDFLIEYVNERTMEESKILGARKDIDSLDECYKMVLDFPTSEVSELTLIVFNRYKEDKAPTLSESRFAARMSNLIDSNKQIREFIMN